MFCLDDRDLGTSVHWIYVCELWFCSFRRIFWKIVDPFVQFKLKFILSIIDHHEVLRIHPSRPVILYFSRVKCSFDFLTSFYLFLKFLQFVIYLSSILFRILLYCHLIFPASMISWIIWILGSVLSKDASKHILVSGIWS